MTDIQKNQQVPMAYRIIISILMFCRKTSQVAIIKIMYEFKESNRIKENIYFSPDIPDNSNNEKLILTCVNIPLL